MLKTGIVIVSLLLSLSVHAQIYKWTDSQGNVHFSDKPHKGAEKIELPEVQTFSPPAIPESKALADEVQEDAGDFYKTVQIAQPESEATIRNNQGLVSVLVDLQPNLRVGDSLQLIYDGNPLGKPQTSAAFTLNNVYRGAHTVAVQVLDSNGKLITQSDQVTFYMHRPRVGMVK